MRIFATIDGFRREVNLDRITTAQFNAYNLAGVAHPFAEEAARQLCESQDYPKYDFDHRIWVTLDIEGSPIGKYDVQVSRIYRFDAVLVK